MRYDGIDMNRVINPEGKDRLDMIEDLKSLGLYYENGSKDFYRRFTKTKK